jgi:hypothetical protein
MKKQLEIMRLQPECFELQGSGNQKVLLEINAAGVMYIVKAVPVVDPIIPSNLTSYPQCR